MNGINPNLGGPNETERGDQAELEKVVIEHFSELETPTAPHSKINRKSKEAHQQKGHFTDDEPNKTDMFEAYVSRMSPQSLLELAQQSKLNQKLTDMMMKQWDKPEDLDDHATITRDTDQHADPVRTGDRPIQKDRDRTHVRRHHHTAQEYLKSLGTDPAKLQPAIQTYIAGLTKSMILPRPGLKERTTQDRTNLLKLGLSNRQVADIEHNVHAFVKKDLTATIHDGYINLLLRYSNRFNTDLYAVSTEYKKLETMGLQSGILESIDKIKALRNDIKKSLHGFFTEILDDKLIEVRAKTLSVAKLSEAMNEMNHFCNAISYDATRYFKTIMTRMDQLGLLPFLAPPGSQLSQMDTDSDGRRRQPPSTIESLSTDHSPDVWGLQQLLLQSVMASGWVNQMEIKFKLSRLKKKLIDSGALSEEKWMEMSQAAIEDAKVKWVDLLKEGLTERAGLMSVSGPEWELVRKKLKKAMVGLKKLQAMPSKSELRQWTNDINGVMYGLMREDFLRVLASLERQPNHVKLIKQAKQLKATLERLKSESGLLGDIMPNDTKVMLTDQRIVESA